MRHALLGLAACALGVLVAVAALPAPGATEDPLESLAAEVEPGPPRWRAGDAWRVQVGESERACWHVVTEANRTHARVGLACDEETELVAIQLAVLDAPTLGIFTRELADPSGEEGTRWFAWPLEHGHSWVTELRGERVTVTTSDADGRFLFTMVDTEGMPVAVYDYDPTLRWWSVFERADGLRLALSEPTSGWRGEVAHAEAQLQAEVWSNFVIGTSASFRVEDEDTHVVAWLTRPTNAVERYQLAGPTAQDVRGSATSAPLVRNPTSDFVIVDAEPGTWTLSQTGTGAGLFTMRAYTARSDLVEL